MSHFKPIPQHVVDTKFSILTNSEFNKLPYWVTSVITERILGDERFLTWPASNEKHHVYVGGLITHTAEVLQYALDAARQLPAVDLTVLITATLYHDYAKIFDYEWIDDEFNGHWAKTAYRHLVRHVSGSHAYFINTLGNCEDLTADQRLNIEHCILSHHGRPEWGSPVEPTTLEAYLLNHADILSARFGTTRLSPGV